MDSIDFLKKAMELQSERGSEYENNKEKERSFEKLATAFNAITNKNLTAAEVALILQLLKDIRQWSADRYHSDSVEDSVSYASLKAELLYDQYHNIQI